MPDRTKTRVPRCPLSLRLAATLLTPAALWLATAVPAGAQATRTWISGVGDDANPCSRTAPCKTWAGAQSKTAAGGEIDALDPGGYGPITIVKSLTLDGTGTFAGILNAGITAINVSAAATDTVIIRGISIQGENAAGSTGIKVNTASSVYVENVNIENQIGLGIDLEPTASVDMTITNTSILHSGGTGILAQMPGSTGNIRLLVDNSRVEENAHGVFAGNGAHVDVRNSTFALNRNTGIFVGAAAGASAEANIENSLLTHNVDGIRASSNGTVRITNTDILTNNTGINVQGGAVVSFGNNRILGNIVNGGPTTTASQQ